MRRRAIATEIKALKAQLSRPRFLRIQAPVLIHEHRPPGEAGVCHCCGSTTAKIVETLPGEDIILDLERGDRFRHGEVPTSLWQELTTMAELRVCPIRCSRPQAELVLDDTDRHLFASGGNRSAKTTAALYWLARQWLLRGGKHRRFWLVASTLPKSYRLLEKLFRGTGESPPILPRELVEYMPSTPRASDLQTRLVDGSLLDLKYFEGDPGAERLKSDSIVAAVVDEAAHLPGPDSLVALRGRCLDAQGRLFFASTPRPSSFLKEDVVQPALEFTNLPDDDPRRDKGEHPGARWKFAQFILMENPWLDRATVEKDLRSLKPDDPAVQRDFYGSWVSGFGLLWRDFDVNKHVLVHETRDFEGLGLSTRGAMGVSGHVNITADVVSMLFSTVNPHYNGVRARNNRYVLGTDVNVHPMTSVAVQVTAPKDTKEDRDTWHYWVMEQVRTPHGSSFAHADQLSSHYFGRILEPTKDEPPFRGCGLIIDAKAIGLDPTIHQFGGDPKGIVALFGRKGFDVRAPWYARSEKGQRPKPPGRKDSHMQVRNLLLGGRLHIHQRCEAVIQAFLNQEDAGDGDEPIKNDLIASAMDALRYVLWGIVHAPAPVRGVWR